MTNGLVPSRWPIRLRVALAFLGATAVAVAALGVFVHVRVSSTLEERLRETVLAEADRLEALAGEDREAAVQALGGDPYAQTLTPDGRVRASSGLVAGPLVEAGSDPVETGFRDATVTVLDDDAAALGDRDVEREESLVLVRRTDDGYLVVGTSQEDAQEALAEVRGQLLVGGPLALALAGGLGYVVAGAALRPIERMRSRAATISDRSAGERLPLPAAEDELRRLAVTLNAMLDRLDEGLQRERRFVAEASHELRTPLALMLTEIELALERPRSAAELTAALRSVDDEVRRMVALAEDLLARAATPDGGLTIDARPVDLAALATRVADRFRPAVGGTRAITVVAPAPVVAPGDELRLDRALSNLVDNALRHGAGDVVIEVSAAPGGGVIGVCDSGNGFRHDSATDPGRPGIGLAIVEEIARAHGGSVEVRRLGHQTRVSVSIPR